MNIDSNMVLAGSFNGTTWTGGAVGVRSVTENVINLKQVKLKLDEPLFGVIHVLGAATAAAIQVFNFTVADAAALTGNPVVVGTVSVPIGTPAGTIFNVALDRSLIRHASSTASEVYLGVAQTGATTGPTYVVYLGEPQIIKHQNR